MNRLARLIGLAVLLLLFFAAAVLAADLWLRRESERVRLATVATRLQQFEGLVALANLGPPPWDDGVTRQVREAVGGRITVVGADLPARSGPGPAWNFHRVWLDERGDVVGAVRVDFPAPNSTRLTVAFERLVVTLFGLALLLLALLGVAALFSSRRMVEEPDDAATNLPAARSEIGHLARLARETVERSTELSHERGVRRRVEEDLDFQQRRLVRALEDKVAMGRNLHDGIIQSLYAVGLTLKASLRSVETKPAVAREQIETSVKTIDATIREVRAYIADLSPEHLRKQTFTESVEALTTSLAAGRRASFELKIDDEAATSLTDAQFTDLLQVVREAVSNGLRHGGADALTIRLHQNGGDLCLLVQDNGSGFDIAAAERSGHGLENMRARIRRLGGDIRFTSTAGQGTRLVATFPAPSAPSS